jgi:GNAT superfamily N-acetyltransferase
MKGFKKFLIEYKELDDLEGSLNKSGVSVSLSPARNNSIALNKIVVPPEHRGKGTGSSIMKKITDHADAHGKRILLTPSDNFGASSVGRLNKFYKKHGFVSNSGKNKDYSTSHKMIRHPSGGTK